MGMGPLPTLYPVSENLTTRMGQAGVPVNSYSVRIGARREVPGEPKEGREEPGRLPGWLGKPGGLWEWWKRVGSRREGPGEARFGGPEQAWGTFPPVFGLPSFLGAHTQSYLISFFPLLFLLIFHPPPHLFTPFVALSLTPALHPKCPEGVLWFHPFSIASTLLLFIKLFPS